MLRLHALRRFVQLGFLSLMVVIPVLNARGLVWMTGTLYSLSFGPVDITDPLSGLQVVLLTWGGTSALWISLVPPLLLALLTGRTFCSWLCPQNLFSELGEWLARRLPIRRWRPAPSPIPGWVVLILLLALGVAFAFPVANLLSAPGVISMQIQQAVLSRTLGIESLLIAGIVGVEILLVPRFWCKHVCGIGTLLGGLRLPQSLRVALVEQTDRVCTACGDCARVCQLGLDPVRGGIYPLCHTCGDCVDACRASTCGANPLRITLGRSLSSCTSPEMHGTMG